MDSVEKSKGVYKKHGEKAKGVYSDKSKLSKFSKKERSEYEAKESWRTLMHEAFSKCFGLLKPGRYCAVFIGNMYHDKEYHFLTHDIVSLLKDIGFKPKGEIVWYDVAKKLHLYGINYSWIPSIVHQFILIFRKERPEKWSDAEKASIEENNMGYAEKHQNP